MDLGQALEHLQRRLGGGPLAPDGAGRVHLAFKGGLALALIPAARGRLIAEVGLGPLPAAEAPRLERLRLLLERGLAMMKAAEEVVALDSAAGRLLVWRALDLPVLTPALLEEQVARLLDRAEWLAGEAAPAPARPTGPMIFFP